jgi:hypothetical protein
MIAAHQCYREANARVKTISIASGDSRLVDAAGRRVRRTLTRSRTPHPDRSSHHWHRRAHPPSRSLRAARDRPSSREGRGSERRGRVARTLIPAHLVDTPRPGRRRNVKMCMTRSVGRELSERSPCVRRAGSWRRKVTATHAATAVNATARQGTTPLLQQIPRCRQRIKNCQDQSFSIAVCKNPIAARTGCCL